MTVADGRARHGHSAASPRWTNTPHRGHPVDRNCEETSRLWSSWTKNAAWRDCSRHCSGQLAPRLQVSPGEGKEPVGRFDNCLRTARSEVNLATPVADQCADARHGDANAFTFELLLDPPGSGRDHRSRSSGCVPLVSFLAPPLHGPAAISLNFAAVLRARLSGSPQGLSRREARSVPCSPHF